MATTEKLGELETRLEKLRIAFERYFLGLEKRPPLRERDQMCRDLQRFQPGKEAVLRFKWQNLTQRLTTYNMMWERTIRAIEEGTYIRDVRRADWRARRKEEREAPDTERAREASKKAKEVGDEAAAFLDQLGAKPEISLRGRPKSGSPGRDSRMDRAAERAAEALADEPTQPEATPPMRGRPRRESAASTPATTVPLRGRAKVASGGGRTPSAPPNDAPRPRTPSTPAAAPRSRSSAPPASTPPRARPPSVSRPPSARPGPLPPPPTPPRGTPAVPPMPLRGKPVQPSDD